jgi:hypothetical protein
MGVPLITLAIVIVTPQRNIVQRALNRAGHRFGIKPFPVAFESSLPEAGQPDVFDAVYETNYWDEPESRSGGGSTIEATADYRPQLIYWLKRLEIRLMFDAPCGDLNWMPLVLQQLDLHYIGGDISAGAVAEARKRCPDLDVRHFNICSDPFPDADLWHCRDALFHLSFDAIRAALGNAARSNVRYAAITTHRARLLRNLDIKTGGYRLLDLERPPFSLPKPLAYIRDYGQATFPRYVAIWPTDALRAPAR